MNFVPDPLHPAVVHFPIVLVLFGAVVAMAAIFWRKRGLPVLAAGLLALGALGTWAAIESGESDGEQVERTLPGAGALVEEHESWAKWTLAVAILAAFAAGGSVLVARWPRTARTVAVAAALISAAAVYAVYETGYRGGALVYRHGVGLQVSGSPPAAPAAAHREARTPDTD